MNKRKKKYVPPPMFQITWFSDDMFAVICNGNPTYQQRAILDDLGRAKSITHNGKRIPGWAFSGRCKTKMQDLVNNFNKDYPLVSEPAESHFA